jgi:hypothetical protein
LGVRRHALRAADAGPMLLPEARPSAAELIAAAGRAEGEATPAEAMAARNTETARETPALARTDAAAPPAADPQAARLLAADAEARRLAADPATRSAELLEAQRIAAERDILVPDDAGQRGARALLDEAEAEAAEAAAAAACLIGGAA